MCCFVFFFFFQAEDGIRDLTVTGVQTCALPISCDVLPALAVATATTAAIEIACTRWSTPVQPTATKIRQVPRSAAMVMPEIGFAEDPIWPVTREDTVRSEEHTSEIQSQSNLVCRLLLDTTD